MITTGTLIAGERTQRSTEIDQERKPADLVQRVYKRTSPAEKSWSGQKADAGPRYLAQHGERDCQENIRDAVRVQSDCRSSPRVW